MKGIQGLASEAGGGKRVLRLVLQGAEVERADALEILLRPVAGLELLALGVLAAKDGILREPRVLLHLARIDEADCDKDNDLLLLLLAGARAKEPRTDPWDVAQERYAVVHLFLYGARKPANHGRRAARHREVGDEALNLYHGILRRYRAAIRVGLGPRLDPAVLRRNRRDYRDVDEPVRAYARRHVEGYAPAEERLLREHHLVFAGDIGHLHVEVEGIAA